ncbi:GTP pyrophosphokinase family protein [Lysinibacillus sp. SGAir0095]|uniref:GTP pyrophosphokinase n=1 Tax=Lysinibacillus sp. SGAir0095 TaxID=2070463 RepID=UPI0010CCC7CA|nr:GTP pyrophosphokinase family protein [Lysinibacillus sp. SGAir0095]QCR31945.1 GTP pyrophosphokinase [Lysinibacillus sp. SGAir0095]
MEDNIEVNFAELKVIRTEITKFMMSYKFALEELNTKINILKQEFQYVHDHNPIEHVSSRLKSPESIIKKLNTKNYNLSLDSIKENVRDIAGIRISCSFISDIYELSEMLQKQQDLKVIEIKDYIKQPKSNGYQSLHLILQVPVFMTNRVEEVFVEVQIRTIAMDFWASLEHKIYYKYNKSVPERLKEELKEAAITAALLDNKMERLRKEMNELRDASKQISSIEEISINNQQFVLPHDLLSLFQTEKDKEK